MTPAFIAHHKHVMRADKMPACSGRKRRKFDPKHAMWLLNNSTKYTASECSVILGYQVDTIRRKCKGLKLELKPVRGK
jgi:hypothetical protein